jgi:ribosomal protein S14
MTKFDDLPHSNRTLLLATLELEIAQAKCANILELAHKHNLSIQILWRDICRRTGQPRCTVPAPVMLSRAQWRESSTAGHPAPAAATPVLESSPSAALTDGGLNAGTVAMPAALARQPRTACGAHRAASWRAPLVAGLIAILALGVGFLVLASGPHSTVAPQASWQISNAKPGDGFRAAPIIRDADGSPQPEINPGTLSPPPGTVHRLDAISKSFLKR